MATAKKTAKKKVAKKRTSKAPHAIEITKVMRLLAKEMFERGAATSMIAKAIGVKLRAFQTHFPEYTGDASGGKPAYRPTDKDRELVRTLASYGFTCVEIAEAINNPKTGTTVSDQTIHKHFRQELTGGHVLASAKVAGALFKKALGKDPAVDTPACIFWLKTRARWSEKTEREDHGGAQSTGVLIVPAQMTTDDWIAEQEQMNLSRANPSEVDE